jgi:hypothetical protein
MLTPLEMRQVFVALTGFSSYNIGSRIWVPLDKVMELITVYADGNPSVTWNGTTISLTFPKRPEAETPQAAVGDGDDPSLSESPVRDRPGDDQYLIAEDGSLIAVTEER